MYIKKDLGLMNLYYITPIKSTRNDDLSRNDVSFGICELWNQSINIHYAPFELGVEYDNGVFSLTFIILWTRVTHKMQHYI